MMGTMLKFNHIHVEEQIIPKIKSELTGEWTLIQKGKERLSKKCTLFV